MDNVTISEMWAGMLFSDFGMAFLAWYLSKVLPWSTDNTQSPLFFLMVSYWLPDAGSAEDAVPQQRDPARFEQVPADQRTIIVAKNLTKVYGDKQALDGLDLMVYQSKITVLLGHNGAGKTTLMTILTGMQAPTSGAARVCGYNVTTHRANVRQLVSFCQQTDIFFDDMTCAENLLYFGSLKAASTQNLRTSIAATLVVVDLQDKAYCFPAELSGGMKRRLSIAITIVSQPKLLILDEPTAGMDPETRRNVWDTLQNVAKERTLLLSTHDMDEADAIGDQVVIMASGKVICSGSTAFLKKACGVGYKLNLGKIPEAFNLKDVLTLVQKSVPTATVEDEKQGDVTIALNTLDYKNFPAMFQTLEGSSKKLGIGNIGVYVASMKDVYLKINMDWAPGGQARESPVDESAIAAVCAPIKKQRTPVGVFFALFFKRLITLIRSWGLLLGSFALPLGVLAYILWKAPMSSLTNLVDPGDQANTINTIPVSLGAYYPGSQVLVDESLPSGLSERLQALVELEGCSVRRMKDLKRELSAMAKQDYAYYMRTYPMAVAFEKDKITLMANPTSIMSLLILVNLMDTASLREQTAQRTAHITAAIAYLEAASGPSRGLIVFKVIFIWLYWAFGPALSYSLGFAAFAYSPVPERLGGSRDVQLMTGMSGATFVFAHFVFDMTHYAIFTGSWTLVHFAFSKYSSRVAGICFAVFLCSGPSVIGVAYLIAERAVSTGGAISNMVLWMYLGGVVSSLAYGAALLFLAPETAHYAFLAFPPYAMISCFTKFWVAVTEEVECEMAERAQKAAQGAAQVDNPPLAFFIVAAESSLISAQRDNSNVRRYFRDSCDGSPFFTFTYEGAVFEMLALLTVGLVSLGVMTYLASGYKPPADMFSGKEVLADEDVEEEKKVVAALRDKRDFNAHTMLAWSLHKRFGNIRAVRGLYMALRPSECFGLLGVNGAGKTTTFQMLAGLTSVSYGDAMTKVATLSADVRTWQSQISYCFQSGGLLDRLNAYEYLYLIGRLRGISVADLKPMVEGILSVVDLKEHASKQCGVYSGGNRRKLSIGAALLGLQPFVFLDEPYAGVDVVSRNKIFRAIALIKKRSQTTFMLTSHNMDECEYSCDRLTIMVQGQMMCLGTLQHLREKFGRGYRLEFMLKHTAAADAGRLAQAVEKRFAGIKLTEAHENVLCYHLEQRIPWTTLFSKLIRLEKEYALEHALVGENTLEQIFLSFAKLQDVAMRLDQDRPPAVSPAPVAHPSELSGASAASHVV